MKILRLLIPLCILAGLGVTRASAGADNRADNIAIVGADVLPMTSRERLSNQTVLISGGRIKEVGPQGKVTVPQGFRTIYAKGQVLMPGLVDMHVHLANEPGKPRDPAQRALAVMLGHGITTVRSMAGGGNHIQLRSAVEEGSIPGPRIYAASPPINVMNTASPEAARMAVQAANGAGFDLIKSHHLPDVRIWEAVQDEARKIGLPVAGHVTNEIGLARALAAHQEIEHLDGAIFALLPADAPERLLEFGQVPPPPVLERMAKTTDAELITLARQVAATHIYQVPTLALFENISAVETPPETLRALPEMRFVPDAVLEDRKSVV